MKSVPNWICYIHANSWTFSPSLAILFNFLEPKTDLDFPNFQFKIVFESDEIPMEKVIRFPKTMGTIFHFKILEFGKVSFGLNQVGMNLNCFKIYLNFTAGPTCQLSLTHLCS
jgi:hypothetical protein